MNRLVVKLTDILLAALFLLAAFDSLLVFKITRDRPQFSLFISLAKITRDRPQFSLFISLAYLENRKQ
jgi:hypothetical protein